MVKEIQLTRGKIALIDDNEYERINAYSWHYHPTKNGMSGYACRGTTIKEKRYFYTMQRMIISCPKGRQIDHINGNKLDNRKCNLRIGTHSQNACNKPKYTDKQYSSKYKGVHFHKNSGRWHAQIELKNVKYHIGMFATQELAYQAYADKAKLLHGDFART